MVRKTLITFKLRKYLKNIATARSECTAKHENKESYNTYYIVPDLNRRLKKEIFIFLEKHFTA